MWATRRQQFILRAKLGKYPRQIDIPKCGCATIHVRFAVAHSWRDNPLQIPILGILGPGHAAQQQEHTVTTLFRDPSTQTGLPSLTGWIASDNISLLYIRLCVLYSGS